MTTILVERLAEGTERLNSIMRTVISRWRQLSPREQGLTAIAMVSLFIWVIWQGIVLPFYDQRELAEQNLTISRGQLSEVRQQAEQVLNLRAAGVRERLANDAPLDQVVHQQAGKYELTVLRVQNRGETLDIDLADTRFDRLMDWLTTLEQQYQITVRSIQLESTETSGVVAVRRLQLERG